MLPPGVVDITVHAHGWQPPGSQPFIVLNTSGPLFECKQLRNSINIAYVGPSKAKDITTVPMSVLSNCIWR